MVEKIYTLLSVTSQNMYSRACLMFHGCGGGGRGAVDLDSVIGDKPKHVFICLLHGRVGGGGRGGGADGRSAFGVKPKHLIIIIRNTYIALNPTRLAQSPLQFKTRMNIRINT